MRRHAHEGGRTARNKYAGTLLTSPTRCPRAGYAGILADHGMWEYLGMGPHSGGTEPINGEFGGHCSCCGGDPLSQLTPAVLEQVMGLRGGYAAVARMREADSKR